MELEKLIEKARKAVVKPLTKSTWPEYLENVGTMGMHGYNDATDSTIAAIKNMLDDSKSDLELRKNLLAYYNGRKRFKADIDRNWDPK